MSRRRPDRGDEGFSLIEIMMSMTIFSIVTTITVSAIVQIYSAVNKIETIAMARDQLATSFGRLDKEIRYATWVNSPGQFNGAWYIEFETPTGCRQLAFNGGVLTLASWTPPAAVGAANTLGVGLTAIPGVKPFTLYAAGSQPFATSTAAAATAGVGTQFKPEFAQIRLQFNSVSGDSVHNTTLPFDITFTAENNNADSPKISDCADGRPE
jgi:prepilin-type N-terminal cleavage/methylation domain-containing protein